MTIEVTGTVYSISQKETKSEKLTIQTLVIAEEGAGNYPNYIPIQFMNDKINLITEVSANDRVKVSANVQGKEWNSKYFLSLNGWKISKG